MSKPQYRYRHQQERKRLKPIVARGGAVCVEPVCVMATRLIPAEWAETQLWHVSHDASGTITIGPSHRRCNLAENARRNNPKRSGKQPPLRRWPLV